MNSSLVLKCQPWRNKSFREIKIETQIETIVLIQQKLNRISELTCSCMTSVYIVSSDF